MNVKSLVTSLYQVSCNVILYICISNPGVVISALARLNSPFFGNKISSRVSLDHPIEAVKEFIVQPVALVSPLTFEQ